MIVALGALHANPHEHLGHVLADLQCLLLHLIIVAGWIAERPAAGRDQLRDNLVDGHIRGELLAEPIEIKQRGLVAHLLITIASNLEQLGELHHPHLDKLLPSQQLIDQPIATPRRSTAQIPIGLFPRRQDARDVEIGASEEDLIGCTAPMA
jgi:hypothetical protein